MRLQIACANLPLPQDNLCTTDKPRGERSLPVFIAVGVMPSADHRTFEYDTMSDRWAQFIVREVTPFVLSHPDILADFPKLAITSDPAGRAIAGCSAGGAAAVIAGWHRPELFGLVAGYSSGLVGQPSDLYR